MAFIVRLDCTYQKGGKLWIQEWSHFLAQRLVELCSLGLRIEVQASVHSQIYRVEGYHNFWLDRVWCRCNQKFNGPITK